MHMGRLLPRSTLKQTRGVDNINIHEIHTGLQQILTANGTAYKTGFSSSGRKAPRWCWVALNSAFTTITWYSCRQGSKAVRVGMCASVSLTVQGYQTISQSGLQGQMKGDDRSKGNITNADRCLFHFFCCLLRQPGCFDVRVFCCCC